MKGISSTANAVLHPHSKEQLSTILASLPPVDSSRSPEEIREQWRTWNGGNPLPDTFPLPPLRLILIQDNLTGHKTRSWVRWCYEHGILLLYTPLGGSAYNMAESIQRILQRRALEGTYPTHPQQIIDNLEAVARHWNQNPTPFIWGGKRHQRRRRAWERRRKVAASGAHVDRPLKKVE